MSTCKLAILFTAVFTAGHVAAATDAPSITSLFPAGGRQGTSVLIQASGTLKPWPVQVQVEGEGIEIQPEDDSGQFSVSISPNARPGVRWLRFYNPEGGASLRPFVVSALEELAEVEPNNANDEAQRVEPSPAIINARLQKSGDVDAFAVALESGQTLVAAIEANRLLGSPMDGVLQVVSPDGFVLAQADDSPLSDPRLEFVAPKAGTYLIRVFAFPATPDSTIRFAGGEDHVYRLTLTTSGYFDLAHPSVVERDNAEVLIKPIGWNIQEDVGPLEISFDTDHTGAVGWSTGLAGSVSLDTVDVPVLSEDEHGLSRLRVPSVICGRLLSDGEIDQLAVEATAGREIEFKVSARAFGSPLDALLQIQDSSGMLLAESDDSNGILDPIIKVKVPSNGELTLKVEDRHGRGGPRFLYRVEAREPTPDFELSIDTDHLELSTQTPLETTVKIQRLNGFDQQIQFLAEGLPEGVVLEPVVSEPTGDSAKEVKLRFLAVGAAPFSGSIRLVGQSGVDEVRRVVGSERVGGSRTRDLWLTVLEAPH